MIEVSRLKKSFGTLKAVNDVSFRMESGQILGLLGPNGAGKTTTVSMISGLVTPDSGEVLVRGRALKGDDDPLKRELGLVPQDLALYEELSALDNLRFFGALQGLGGPKLKEASASVLAFVGLSERADDRVRTYSGGMKRRLNLAAGLLHDPPVLLLDEPTVGVDPQSRNAIFDTLERLRDSGKAILYTTHYMEEAERLCDRLVIIDHGQVIADDTMAGLGAKLPPTNRLVVELESEAPSADKAWIEELKALPAVLSAEAENGRLSVGLRDLASGAPEVLGWLVARGVRVTGLTSERADLETIFLALTGRSLRD
jgi:ABC-2 type transport system ATP-binding protein